MITTEELKKELIALAQPVFNEAGFDLIELNVRRHGSEIVVQILADRPTGGISMEECSFLNRKIVDVFDAQTAIAEEYSLELSSPGLDRPLRREADYLRFEGQAVSITLKEPFEGRKVFKGLLGRAEAPAEAWTLTFVVGKAEQVLGFSLEEVREARLVPVLDFKGRRGSKAADATATGNEPLTGAVPQGLVTGVDGG